MAIVDSKSILWKFLRDEYNRLHTLYPDRIDTKVTTTYPMQLADIDRKALVVVSRVNTPEEMRLVGDVFSSGLDQQNAAFLMEKGNLQTDYFEISIWCLNPNYRDDLYLLTRQILQEFKSKLLQQGFIKFVKTGGRDFEAAIERLPRTVYGASLTYMIMTRLEHTTVEDLVADIEVDTIIVSSVGPTGGDPSMSPDGKIPGMYWEAYNPDYPYQH